jgi:hypothetical protein
MQEEKIQGWPKWVTDALGAQRTELLGQLVGQVAQFRAMTVDASTMDVVLLPLKGRAARDWQRLAQLRHEDWVFLKSSDGPSILAMDEPSEAGKRDYAAAVVYPELHTRVVSWWLVHAWRGVDLLEETLESLRRWRITSGAVNGRALVEEAGSLVYEAQKLAQAWKVGKAVPADPLNTPATLRDHAGARARRR